MPAFDFSSVKKIVYGGSPMALYVVLQAMEQFHCQMEQALGRPRAAVWQFFCRKTISVRQTMHRTENSALSRASLPLVQIKSSPGNRQRRGKAAGLRGKLRVKSPFCGTWDTKKGQHNTADGYHPTGDKWMGGQRRLCISGRAKHDLIISGGEKRVSCKEEVEDCIAGMTDTVKAVCVLGMPEPCWGEIVVACVVRKENVSL